MEKNDFSSLILQRIFPNIMKVLLGLVILLGVICILVQSFILCVIHE